ncbi:hypothetical protein NP511_09215 [Natrinema thermotolerans]|uniref:Uncharacterized protein n=1 Tax=Natrinema thermotolerans TaxID=121872 RepID=A0AAF0PFK2_9EURY|nr:hypothetical protein [Natrinema thermotolerans]WMT09791.1 hypothetical protein NP511_09215 [Natrinema thermotolerans]
MHSDIGRTFDVIYNSGFIVPVIEEESFGTEPTDPQYPRDHPLVSPSKPPAEAFQDLEHLRVVGALTLEEIYDEEMYVLTEKGFEIAHDREINNRKIELEKRKAKRQRELSKGVGLVSFALVYVSTISLLYQDMQRWAADWQILFILSTTFGIVVVSYVYLIKQFNQADNAGWENI